MSSICSFQAGPDVTLETTYEDFREGVLQAGRFSVFEATESPRALRMVFLLEKDPTVKLSRVEYPWTKVELV